MFTVVLIDGDRSDYVAVVRRAAQEDVFCGEFLISSPDFEFAHLSRTELEEMIWQLVSESYPGQRDVLRNIVQGATNGEKLLQAAREAFPEHSDALRKGTAWGRRLMEFVLNGPQDAGTERPLIRFVRSIANANEYNFASTRNRMRTDPNSGRLVPRGSADGHAGGS